jgi:hypothetical protein
VRAVDSGVIAACLALLTDDVIARTREIITEALDVRQQHDTRIREHERLTREIALAAKRARAYEEMAADSDGEERARHRVSLREQLDRLAALKTQLQEVEAQQPPPDPQALLANFDARVADLRATLAKGGIEALPAVAAILQDQRLTAHRRSDGRWDLRGEASPIVLVAEVGKNQRAAIQAPAAEPAAAPAATAGAAPVKTGA